MSPAFSDQDFVFTGPIWSAEYQPGDVVVLKHHEYGMMVKRIVCYCDRKQRIQVKGDNRLSLHPNQMGWIPVQNIKGKVVWHVRQQRV